MVRRQCEGTATMIDWMMTYTGRHVAPFDPQIADINIMDIAHHLSGVKRYTGATEGDLSVAEHSYWIAWKLRKDGYSAGVQLAGLLHDAQEAWMNDMGRPHKNWLAAHYPAFAKFWDEREDVIGRRVAEVYGVVVPLHPSIKLYDKCVVHDERDAQFGPKKPWALPGKPLGVNVRGWSKRKARRKFLMLFVQIVADLPNVPRYNEARRQSSLL
jgi:hypothetical protein